MSRTLVSFSLLTEPSQGYASESYDDIFLLIWYGRCQAVLLIGLASQVTGTVVATGEPLPLTEFGS